MTNPPWYGVHSSGVHRRTDVWGMWECVWPDLWFSVWRWGWLWGGEGVWGGLFLSHWEVPEFLRWMCDGWPVHLPAWWTALPAWWCLCRSQQYLVSDYACLCRTLNSKQLLWFTVLSFLPSCLCLWVQLLWEGLHAVQLHWNVFIALWPLLWWWPSTIQRYNWVFQFPNLFHDNG